MSVFVESDVFEVMTHIPKGKVVTYGEIAMLVGCPGHARSVGATMRGAYKLALPCHRVVFADGSLVPGWDEQAALLRSEGVVIKSNGKVDMAKSAWRPLSEAM